MNPIDPLISVAVPLHNDAAHVAPFVAELLDVLAGVTSLYEVILVDDGSTDGTARRRCGSPRSVPACA